MNRIISASLIVLLISIYFFESVYSKNIRSYDLIIPWNKIFPERYSLLSDIENLSDWLHENTSKDSIILSNFDYIRALSRRSVLGSNATPLRIDQLNLWLENKLLFNNYLENTSNQQVIEAINRKGIDFIIVPNTILSKYKTVYSSDTYKILEVP